MHRIGLELIEERRKELLSEQTQGSASKLSVETDEYDMPGRDLLSVLRKYLLFQTKR